MSVSFVVALCAVVRLLRFRYLWMVVGVACMVGGAYALVTSFADLNIWQAESGTLVFYLGANILVWSLDI